jgi:GTPase SAR1 family protein
MAENSVSQIKAKVKVVFLGDQSTGKTSIITRFINNKFEQDIGVSFILYSPLLALIFLPRTSL